MLKPIPMANRTGSATSREGNTPDQSTTGTHRKQIARNESKRLSVMTLLGLRESIELREEQLAALMKLSRPEIHAECNY